MGMTIVIPITIIRPTEHKTLWIKWNWFDGKFYKKLTFSKKEKKQILDETHEPPGCFPDLTDPTK